MCDYSLQDVETRPAEVGDKLVVTRITNIRGAHTLSKGFSPVNDPCMAVCVLPGTEIAFEQDIRESAYHYGLDCTSKVHETKVARFRQVNVDEIHKHHDALELADGTILTLQALCEGQCATVLQLPALPTTKAEAKAQERVANVG